MADLSALIRFWERERCRRPTLLIFEVWMREQGMFDAARLVFIDDIRQYQVMRLGRCVRGERLVDHVPQGLEAITFVLSASAHENRRH